MTNGNVFLTFALFLVATPHTKNLLGEAKETATGGKFISVRISLKEIGN